MSVKTSYEYADQIRKLAEYLDSIPVFELDYSYGDSLSFYAKTKFVAAVKAVGSGTKAYTDGEYGKLLFTPDNFPELALKIDRSAVCRKVVKFECDPLFSDDELEKL